MGDYTTPPLIPPFRFSVVEGNLFRGAYPKERCLRFMKRLKLKTWIALLPEPPVPHVVQFCEQENIQLIHIKAAKPKENVTLSFSRVTKILQILIDIHQLPAYIHCIDGTSVTSLVIACLRRLQLWDMKRVINEFCRFASIESEEKTFIERFHGDMMIPDQPLPKWLWGGTPLHHHPILPKLRFEHIEKERKAREQAVKEAKEAAKHAMRRRISAHLLRDTSDTPLPTSPILGICSEETLSNTGSITATNSELALSVSSGDLRQYTPKSPMPLMATLATTKDASSTTTLVSRSLAALALEAIGLDEYM